MLRTWNRVLYVNTHEMPIYLLVMGWVGGSVGVCACMCVLTLMVHCFDDVQDFCSEITSNTQLWLSILLGRRSSILTRPFIFTKVIQNASHDASLPSVIRFGMAPFILEISEQGLPADRKTHKGTDALFLTFSQPQTFFLSLRITFDSIPKSSEWGYYQLRFWTCIYTAWLLSQIPSRLSFRVPDLHAKGPQVQSLFRLGKNPAWNPGELLPACVKNTKFNWSMVRLGKKQIVHSYECPQRYCCEEHWLWSPWTCSALLRQRFYSEKSQWLHRGNPEASSQRHLGPFAMCRNSSLLVGMTASRSQWGHWSVKRSIIRPGWFNIRAIHCLASSGMNPFCLHCLVHELWRRTLWVLRGPQTKSGLAPLTFGMKGDQPMCASLSSWHTSYMRIWGSIS